MSYLITPLRRSCSVSFFPAFISLIDIVNFHQNRDFFYCLFLKLSSLTDIALFFERYPVILQFTAKFFVIAEKSVAVVR